MAEAVHAFEAYLKNALDACLSARVARAYKCHETAAQSAANAFGFLEAAFTVHKDWAKQFPSPDEAERR